MTLTELRYIVAAAQERHFGRTSDRCCITRPGLTAQALYDEPFKALVPVGRPWQKKKVIDSRQLGAKGD